MKAIVAAFSKEPDLDRLRLWLAAFHADLLVFSMPSGVKTPELGVKTIRIDHVNCPPDVVNAERVRWVMNRIDANLARVAALKVGGDDEVLFLHQTVNLTPQFIEALGSRLADPFRLVCGKPVTAIMPDGGEVLVDHSTRCLLWRGDAFCKYMTVKIPKERTPTGSTMDELMPMMDADGVRYLWTGIPVSESA